MKKKAFLTYLLILTCLAVAPKPALADATADLAQAASFAQQGDYDRAVQAYQQIADATAGTDEGFTAVQNLILLHLREGKRTDAQTAYKQLMADYSKRADLVQVFEKELASAFRESGDYKTALEIYQYMIAAQPNSKSVIGWRTGLIKCNIGLDDDPSARAEQAKLLTDYANHPSLSGVVGDLAYDYADQKKWVESRELYEYYVANWPQNKDAMRSARYAAKASMKLGDYTKVDQAIDSMISTYADNPKISYELTELAYDYADHKKWAESRELYEYCLTNWPQNKDAMLSARYAAMASIKLGEYEKADQAIDSLASTYADNPEIGSELSELADAYGNQNKWAEARELYEYCLTNWPQSDEAMESQRDVVRSSIRLGDDANAVTDLEKLIADFGQDDEIADAVREIGDEYCDLKRYDKAVETYEYALGLWPESDEAIEAQKGLVLAHTLAGDTVKGDAAIAKLMTDFGETKVVVDEIEGLTETLIHERKYEDAAKLYGHVVSRWPASEQAIWAQTQLARTYITIGESAKAAEAAEKLKKDFADAPNIAASLEDVGDMYQLNFSQREAYALYKYVLAQWPTFERAIWVQTKAIFAQVRMRDLDQSEVELSNLLNDFSNHKDLPAMVHEVVEEYRNIGLYKEGRGLFAYIIENWEQDEGTMLELQVGIALQSIKLKELDEAQTAVDKVIADYNDHPNIGKALFQIAEQYFYAKRHWDTIDLLEIIHADYAASSFPARNEAPFVLATCYKRVKEWDKALENYERALNEYPKGKFASWVPYNLAWIYNHQKVDYNKAIYWYEKQRELYPDANYASWALFDMGCIYVHTLKDYNKGREVCRQYADQYPDGTDIYGSLYNLATCHENLGDTQKALEILSQAYEKAETESLAQSVIDRIQALDGGTK